ncbi:peptide-methionine (S)-S-oxide reductase MsrA [Halobacillus sp. ACCC02827]|uniref:peptide-methionine (S)-S-oxide reductase MsrA n=1 Tax=Bacillaceae TaxID=186817 RepID=UPI0002A51F86|nr:MULTISPECIES: peptide-methionine (S)-S-oxide reductase MsrA [Bacillaceae]ELK46424.1 peptide methionine sulfoxide reductase [Halobacillus sp. BAB-2008]QHT45716.1 peptide-methionine (S)-S-oxide reductase MsrA [Bacillus sp. SB49]WJE16514.1 peptide-methionine (S)-S-oxide reductase MsrA [Halobacillus sp. ACCC02827]
MATAIFGAGCFWGVEAFFEKFEGVTATKVGYIGGKLENPTYEQVKTGKTGHAEAVRIEYDPTRITYSELINIFFEAHDPTSKNKQGIDVGHQYRSAIFYSDASQKYIAEEKIKEWEEKGTFKRAIVTEVEEATSFFEAEEYHQKYLQKNGSAACSIG